MSRLVSIEKYHTKLLRAVPYFQFLDDATLHVVAVEVIVREYQANEVIFWEGEPDAGLHLVEQGSCKIYRISEGGREHILATLGPGDSCNEVPVVDNGPNPANFMALERAIVWVISANSLNKLRQEYPTLNDIIIKNLAMRCRQLVKRVYNLSFLSVTGRLAAFLLEHCEEGYQLNRRDWTHDEIAAHLGTVREMVGRAFKELQGAKLIEVDRQVIKVLDSTGLEEMT